jgi:hypothetical protein
MRGVTPSAQDNDAATPVPDSAGGVEVKYSCRPKANRFKMLSVLWIFPSLGALVILGLDTGAWIQRASLGDCLAAVPLQSWMAVMVLVAHGLFLGLARHYHRTEPWQDMVYREAEIDRISSPNL